MGNNNNNETNKNNTYEYLVELKEKLDISVEDVIKHLQDGNKEIILMLLLAQRAELEKYKKTDKQIRGVVEDALKRNENIIKEVKDELKEDESIIKKVKDELKEDESIKTEAKDELKKDESIITKVKDELKKEFKPLFLDNLQGLKDKLKFKNDKELVETLINEIENETNPEEKNISNKLIKIKKWSEKINSLFWGSVLNNYRYTEQLYNWLLPDVEKIDSYIAGFEKSWRNNRNNFDGMTGLVRAASEVIK